MRVAWISASQSMIVGSRDKRVSSACAAIGDSGERRVAAPDLHPVPGTHVRIIGPDREVLRAAVVPESDRVLLPAKTALEVRFLEVAVEERKQRGALEGRQLVDVRREAAVHVQQLALRLGVP